MTRLSVLCVTAAAALCILLSQPAAAAEEWAVDPVHSAIVWNVGHMNGAGLVFGRFNSFSGTIMIDDANPELSTVAMSIDATSLDTAVAPRDEHLRSADFFNVAKFATIGFQSTEIAAVQGQSNMYAVSGDLTLLGVSRPVTVMIEHRGQVTDKDGKAVTGFGGEFIVKRSEFGMNYGIPGLSDEIHVMLSFECRPAADLAKK